MPNFKLKTSFSLCFHAESKLWALSGGHFEKILHFEFISWPAFIFEIIPLQEHVSPISAFCYHFYYAFMKAWKSVLIWWPSLKKSAILNFCFWLTFLFEIVTSYKHVCKFSAPYCYFYFGFYGDLKNRVQCGCHLGKNPPSWIFVLASVFVW